MKTIATIVAATSVSLLAQSAAPTPTADGFLFVTFRGQDNPLSKPICFALSKDGRI